MYTYNNDVELIDLIDLINFTLSNNFIEKWRFIYSTKFIKIFQLKLLHILSKQKPIKVETLKSYFIKKYKYKDEQIVKFFKDIDISLYKPIIYLS